MRSSSPQVVDAADAVLRMNITASALSTADLMSVSHSAVGGMSSQSTQTSWPAATRESRSLLANALSALEYDTNRLAMARLRVR